MGMVTPRYFDLWAVVKDDARKVVEKGRKGFTFTAPLKPFHKPRISQKKALEVIESGYKSQANEKTIPKEIVFNLVVYDPEMEFFDANDFYAHVKTLAEMFAQKFECEVPVLHLGSSKSGEERKVAINVSWREPNPVGGSYGLLF